MPHPQIPKFAWILTISPKSAYSILHIQTLLRYSGVPQDFVLGHLLFLIRFSALFSIVYKKKNDFFVDDTQLYYSENPILK